MICFQSCVSTSLTTLVILNFQSSNLVRAVIQEGFDQFSLAINSAIQMMWLWVVLFPGIDPTLPDVSRPDYQLACQKQPEEETDGKLKH